MIFKNISLVTIFNFFTKLLGYIRDFFIAFFFGTTSKAELFIILLELKYLFLPFFHNASFEKNLINKYIIFKNKSIKEKFFYTNSVFLIFFVFLFSLIILTFFFSDKVFFILYPGFKDRYDISYILSVIKPVLIFNIFNFLITYISTILQSEKKFFFNSLFLIAPNVCFIIYICFAYFIFDNEFIINQYGLFIILISIIQIYFFLIISDINFIKYIKYNFYNIKKSFKYFKDFFQVYLYSFFYILCLKLFLIIEKFFLSFKESYISMFYISERIANLPVSIVIIAFSTVLLPEFVTRKNQDTNEVSFLFSSSIKICLILISSVSLFFFFNAEILIDILFGRGNFNAESVFNTSKILELHSFGIVFFALQLIFYIFFISKKENNLLFHGSIFGLIISSSFMLLLYYFDNYKYFALNLLIFNLSQNIYLICKLDNHTLKVLIQDLKKNLKFFYSIAILFILLIMLKNLSNISQLSFLIISSFAIIINFIFCIYKKFIVDKNLNRIIKKLNFKKT
jgi:putative peptidoglycan lipid II flippase